MTSTRIAGHRVGGVTASEPIVSTEPRQARPWILSPRLLGVFLLVVVAYGGIAEVADFKLIETSAVQRIVSFGRVVECTLLWVVLCSAAGWVAYLRNRRPAWNATTWPIWLIPVTMAFGAAVSETLRMFANPPTWGALPGGSSPFWFNAAMIAVPVGVPLACGVMCSGLLVAQARLWRCASRQTCPFCGYDLQGNSSGTCPECGAEVVMDSSIALRFHRLTFPGVPELAKFPDAKTRSAAWARAIRETFGWRAWLAVLVSLGVIAAIDGPWLEPHLGRWHWIAAIAAYAAVVLVAIALNRVIRRSLRRQLDDRRAS